MSVRNSTIRTDRQADTHGDVSWSLSLLIQFRKLNKADRQREIKQQGKETRKDKAEGDYWRGGEEEGGVHAVSDKEQKRC